MLNFERMNKTSISAELNIHLSAQKQQEILESKEDLEAGELEEALEDIERYYDLLASKLGFVPKIETIRPELKRKFIEMLLHIDKLQIGDGNKLAMIATYAAIINLVATDLEHLTISETSLLCVTMIPIKLENYDMYGTVLSNQNLLKAIESKSDNRNHQLDICDSIFEYCDEHADRDMDNEDYLRVINDCTNIVSKYKVPETSKIKE